MESSFGNLLIYYLSGTGNALAASRWMVEKADAKGIHGQMLPVDRLKFPEIPTLKGTTLIGFCFPTHGFGIPWFMLKFVWRFPKVKNSKVFICNTRAGSKLGKVFLPGISGMAQWIPFLILLLKGYSIRGLLPLDMPSNWISVHPGYKTKVIASIFERNHGIVTDFISKLLQNRRFYHYWVFATLPLDLALAPVMLGYQMYGRFLFAKMFIATNQCNGCGICYEKCPVGAIRMYAGKPYWTVHCESCMRCISLCPEKAIQASHLMFGIMIIAGAMLPVYFFIFDFFGSLPHAVFNSLDFFLEWVYKVSLFSLLYFIVYLLLKFKPIAYLFEYTSLTRYWRGYRAPGISKKDYLGGKKKRI
ncbi:MAG: EFR1 family ferrodoxin [Bacteroidota bacterium]